MTAESAPGAGPATLPWSAGENADAATTMHLLSGMLETELRRDHGGVPALPRPILHAPTMLSAIGVIAGYAAQCAAAAAILRRATPRARNDMLRVECKDGSVLYYGDEINRHLILDPNGAYALAGFLGGAVIHAGCTRADIADTREILGHVSAVAGTPLYDIVRAPPAHAPLWNVSQTLRVIWPKARLVLEHRLRPATVKTPMPVQHWPVAASIVAQQYIGLAKDIVPPPVAMAIVLESAIKASKRRLVGPDASPLWSQESTFFAPGLH